jgi:hypothetical protein
VSPTRTTSRDYANPHRPWLVRGLNHAWGALGGLASPSLDPDDLLRAARNAERLTDPGPDPWREPLERLVQAIERESRLHPLGRQIVRTRLVNNLRARLAEQACFEQDPSILQRAVPAPVFITGLQRTGTTLLHRLLATDPRFRALRSWEALRPSPLPRERSPDDRRRAAQLAARAVGWLAPDFQAVHPIEPDAPEEEVIVLDQTFLSTVAEATLRVPSYSVWLEEQDQRPAYRMLRKVLQLLDDGRTWVLKTPHHLEHLDALLEVFPDARFVHTHRDPVVTLGSFCSMVAHGHGLCTDQVDPHEIGQHWLRKTDRMLSRALQVRDQRALTVHDVDYRALMHDPLGTVTAIYEFLGLPTTSETERQLQAQLTESPQHKWGRHVYALADFGLDEATVARTHSAYRERFGLTA